MPGERSQVDGGRICFGLPSQPPNPTVTPKTLSPTASTHLAGRLLSILLSSLLAALTVGGAVTVGQPGVVAPGGASDETAAKRLACGKRRYHDAGACIACLGADRKPTVPEAPDLTDTEWQRKRTDADLATAIGKGKGTMPPFKGSEADIEALVAYVRSLAR